MPKTTHDRRMPAQVQRLALVLGLGVLLGFAGPFGSYPAYEREVRYAFWLGLVLWGFVFAHFAARLLELYPAIARRGRGPMSAATVLASALPMTFVAAWALGLAQPGRTVSIAQLPVLYACVSAVQFLVVIALIRPVLPPRDPRTHHRVEQPPSVGTISPVPEAARPGSEDARESDAGANRAVGFPRVLTSRIPPELGSEIIALEAEDHYVRVHTPKGSALTLMRLSEAIDLIDERLGFRVHRSWWVARNSIHSFDRDGQSVGLRLVNGTKVPVGRMYVAAVRSALK